MDTQPKVIFKIHRPYLEPKVQEAVIDESCIAFSGIEVSEYDRVEVQFNSPFDKNSVLKIETYESNEELELRHSEQPITVMNGYNSEHMLVPGHYRIELLTNNKKILSYYKVRSKDFSDESLMNLRSYLENMLKGLSYDLIKQKLGMASPVTDFNPTLLQLFQFINKYKDRIKSNLDLIVKDPITDLKGEYNITTNPRKLDNKSFRWQALKGEQKDSVSISPRVFYEKHTKLAYNNVENQWVKFIINFFLQLLRKLEVSFMREISEVTKKSESQHLQLLENRNRIEIVKNGNPFGYQKSLESLKRNEKRIQRRIEELEKEMLIYSKQKLFLRKLTYFFTEYEKTSWILPLSPHKPKKITQRMLKDYRYRKIYHLYKELARLENRKVESQLPGLQFRRTWQLFEYYNVGLVINILKEVGYKWVDGWLAAKDNPHMHIGTLPAGTIMRFEREESDHYIELAYDNEIENSIIDQSYSRYFNDAGRRPDILLTIYSKDGSLYSNKAGLIIESKCRRHRYLINQSIDPDVKQQLRDFKNLEYFDASAYQSGDDPVKTPIQKVIVLYPKQTGIAPVKLDHVYGESMVYLQVEPNDPNINEVSFGYENLKAKLDSFISQVD
jgi:Domain of unknown function (DUF2357)